MKVPIAFLKEYIDIDLSIDELADLLTLAGLEVDAIEIPNITFTDVVVAKVEKAEKHPDADKLQVATVFDGTDRWQVVCGAPNCREGLVTAFAKIGATLQDKEGTWKVKKAKLRGIESSGMLASGKELGLNEDHIGILELPEEMEVGVEIAKYFEEPILEISLTPNLGHCMSILGIAREISAITEKETSLPSNNVHENPNRKIEKNLQASVEAKTSCDRYALRLIEDLQEAETPFWIKQYLYDSNLRPLHPIVDIMNFVMLEMGQPLHAFDYETIAEKTLSVEKTTKEEDFIGLDGEKRTIPKESIVIRDPNKTLAIAGIIGGENSSITHKSKSILIEAADFDSITVRKTSQKLCLRTESSMRFEKRIDGGNIIKALDRACHLIEKICKGKVASGTIDIKQHDYVGNIINVRIDRVNKLLGTSLSENEIESIFVRLGCTVSFDKKNQSLKVQVPTARNDLEKEIDLVEEVARIYGYNHIPKLAPLVHTATIPHSPSYLLEKKLRESLTREGLQEFLNCDIISPDLAKTCKGLAIKEESLAKICQASSVEYSVMRPSLLPALLQVVAHNQAQNNPDISAFEVGYCYLKKTDGSFSQQPMTSIILSGDKRPQVWDKSNGKWDYYDLKAMLENLFNRMNIEKCTFTSSSYEAFHPHIQAEIFVNDQPIGVIGEIHPDLQEQFGIKQKVYFAQLNSLVFIDTFQQDKHYSPLPLYPCSERDWTVTVDKSQPVASFFDTIHELDSEILEKAYCLDVFEKDTEVKNITFRFVYRSDKKTLSHEEVEKEHLRIVEKLAKCSLSQ